MNQYKKHFLLSVDQAAEYAKYIKLFPKDANLCVHEIGNGNINYVYRVVDKNTGKSVVLKQADKYLRASGRPLTLQRSKIEANILKIQDSYAPGYVPEVYNYDDVMCIIAMEDISEYKNMRLELYNEIIFDNFADDITTFIVNTLLPTTDLVMDSAIKKDHVAKYINKELCDISECLVFTEPYVNDRNRNIVINENMEFVNKYVYSDKNLHTEAAKLKNNFMNNAQALIHGDLHTGSIFINEKGIKVIDPEFSFYGPIGYDLGNVIGNLFFPLINKKYLMPYGEDKNVFISRLEKTIKDILNIFIIKFEQKYDQIVKKPLYKGNKSFAKWYMDCVVADSIGAAGQEILRRVIGDTKVMEITSIEDVSKRIDVERELIKIAIRLIKERTQIKTGDNLL